MTDTTTPARRDRKLYKDPIDKKIGGVASGVAKYFDVDTTLMRAAWAVSIFIGGFGLLLYLVLWFILDDDPDAFAEPIAPRPVEVDEDSSGYGDAVDTARNEIDAETVEAALDSESDLESSQR